MASFLLAKYLQKELRSIPSVCLTGMAFVPVFGGGFVHDAAGQFSFAANENWWAVQDSNLRHSRCKRDALTN